jgi:hypothetical protein
MREIKIVFTRSKKKVRIISTLIMWWTGKEYSHVARGLLRRNWGYGYYHASEGRVNYEHERMFNTKNEIVKEYSLRVSDEVWFKVSESCWKEAGQPYGFMQNIGIVIVDIAAKMGIKIDTPFKKGMNCSELMYRDVFKVMFPELDYNPDTIKPHQIEEIIINKCSHLISN